jgi:hypothetical protein
LSRGSLGDDGCDADDPQSIGVGDRGSKLLRALGLEMPRSD